MDQLPSVVVSRFVTLACGVNGQPALLGIFDTVNTPGIGDLLQRP